MIRIAHNWGLLAGAFAIALALLLGGTASAEEGEESLLNVISITDDLFVKIPASESPSGPVNAAFVAPGAGWMAAGVHRFEVGETWVKDWVYWYHEFVYVTQGRGKITLSAPPYTKSESKEVKAGDLFTIPPSMKVTMEALGDETFEIVWAAPE
jgi:mannose-6-phosphate isomerase-like protein (cupin superfamily)